MKKLIENLKNIWSIKELRTRILITLGFLAVYRFGSYVVLPGIDGAKMAEQAANQSGEGLIGILNLFTGGAFSQASIFALGIMPYISASIIVQLLGFAVPYFQKLQREGEAGTRKINQITRMLTIAITAVQGSAYLTYIMTSFGADILTITPTLFGISSIIILTAGTVFAMWIGERITDRGVGNGISLLIMIGIIANLPIAFSAELELRLGAGGLVALVLELAFLIVVVMGNVALVQAVRRIPLQYAKRMVGRTNMTQPVSGVRDYLPVKVNASGVMPIIFAQALMLLPATVIGFAGAESGGAIVSALNNWKSVPYNIIYFFMIVLFTYVYTALIVNPQQHAEHLKRQNAFIPGVKPGRPTADFIDVVTTRITLPGSVALALVAIMPAFAAQFGVNDSFALFYGGTSLLIIVGVVLDTLQQIEAHLMMRQYDGLIKGGRLKGRGRQQAVGASM